MLSPLVKGQYFSSGQDPASTKWKQINTSNFQIIFPDNFEVQAQYLANILDSAYSLVAFSLNGTIKKTSIILHTQTVISNGTTAWAPTRIDLHTTSPQQIYAQPWLDQLALHEIRHLIQIEKLNTGLTNVLKIILGEQALAFITGIFIPQWFLEGDAVVTETALSHTGRGREPSFIMPIKAQLLEKKTFSYEKSVHGSYKDFVSDPYPLGYLLVASGRNKFGSKLWENAIVNTGRNPFQITPFSHAIKKTTGFTKQQFYYSVMNELIDNWDSMLSSQSFPPLEHLTKRPSDFTNYHHPVIMDEENILSVKSCIDDVQRIVRISPNGEEKIIFTPGPSLGDRLSYSQGLLCWSEVEFDARWQNRNFSVIKTYNLKSKKLTHLTKNSRLFSPVISHDAKKIVAVEQSSTDESSLVILDALNGKELERFRHLNHEFLITPSWSDDDNKIIMITLNNQGKSIQVLDLKSGEFEKQTPETYISISNPRITNDTIYFIGAFSGTDNIYALDRSSKIIYQISHVKFGANDVLVEGKNDFLLFTNYTADGYEIVKQNFSDAQWVPLTEIKKCFSDLPLTFLRQEKGVLEIDHRDDITFDTEKYHKANNLFDIHSWAPVSINVNSYDVKPGFSVMSQNKLSTSFTTLGYEYDLNESLGKYYFNYSYEGFYPIYDLEVDHGKKRYYFNDSTHQIKFLLYDETNIETQVRLPLSFSKGRYYRGIQPSIKFRNSFLKEMPDQKINFTQHEVHSLNYRLYLYNQIRSSSRDLYPAWGQLLDFKVGHTPFQIENKSWLISAQSVLYFPGLFKHHGIKIVNGYQKRQEGVYHFPQEVNYPRGFYNHNDLELFRTSINYKLPLCYPDFHIGSLFYLKRLKLALYYDQANGKNAKGNTSYRSTGFELTSDMYFFSLIAPVDMGVRYIYYPDQKTNVFEFLFYIDFSALY